MYVYDVVAAQVFKGVPQLHAGAREGGPRRGSLAEEAGEGRRSGGPEEGLVTSSGARRGSKLGGGWRHGC